MIPFEERPETIRGRRAELAVSRWLQQTRGWHVLPAYDYAGQGERKAPRLEGLPTSLVVPDLLAARQGVSAWFEVKLKTHADYTYLTGRQETGIALRLWNHYLEVQALTGLRVWLVFVHEDEDEVRAGDLASLAVGTCLHGDGLPTMRIYDGGKMGHSGMAFFCWECLIPMARTSELLETA
jgi:hypothetical protein